MKHPVKNCKWALYPVGDITQWFGENPKLYAPLGLDGHNGIDIVRPHGEHLYAVEDGIICNVKEDLEGYGKHVRLISKSKDKRNYHRDWVYGHLSFIAVKNGQEVKAGQYLGNMGNTGFVVSGQTANGFRKANPYAGTHLHFGCRYVKESASGWSYEGHPKTWAVVNGNNGYMGRVDFLPLFLDPALKSTAIMLLASKRGDSVVFKFGELLAKIGL
jgi:murein DD-endopeptidase MepM/ murein hydrolase activator NlpD